MIKNFTKRIREYKKDIFLSVGLMVMAVVIEVTIPYIMSQMIDYGIATGDIDAIFRIGGLLVGVSLTSLALGLLSSRYLAVASTGFVKNVRQDLYHHVTNFPFQSIDKFSTASLITRLTTDISSLQGAFSLTIRVCSRSPLIMLFALIMAFRINSRLALVFIFVLPFLGILIALIIRKAFPLFRLALKTYDNLNQVVNENLKGIRVVKSFVREDYEIKKFEDVSTDIFTKFTSAEKIVAFFQPSMQLATYACMVLISWFGAQLIVAETMSVGQLMSFIIYISQILMALIMMSMLFISLAMSRASAERIQEVFDEKLILQNPDNPIMEIPNANITFENVSFGYSAGKNVLENVSLTIKEGQTVGILGGTGSSKTSLVQLIPRLYDVTEGAVKIGGIDVRNLNLPTLREQVSMVLQKNTLFTGTVTDNLRWGDKSATQEQLITACKMAQIHDFIESLPGGYNTEVEQGGANFSGGQRQRLCIARAILKRPRVFIFDDSTSAVDTNTEAQIMNAIKENLPGATKIIISQRISSVKDLDTIVLMDDRKIAGIGSHSHLMETSEIYREIYSSQNKEEGE